MKLNITLLEKVARAIQEHPDNTDMDVFVTHDSGISECGTVGCIAGWTLADGDIEKLRRLNTHHTLKWYHTRAAKKLGLTYDGAVSLFFTDAWPDKLRREFRREREGQMVGLGKATRHEVDFDHVASLIVRRIKQFIARHAVYERRKTGRHFGC